MGIPSVVPIVSNVVALAKRLALRPLAEAACRVAAQLKKIAEGLLDERDHSGRGVGKQVRLVRHILERLNHALEVVHPSLEDLNAFCVSLPEQNWLKASYSYYTRVERWFRTAQCTVERKLQNDARHFETPNPGHFEQLDLATAKRMCKSSALELLEVANELHVLSADLDQFIGISRPNGTDGTTAGGSAKPHRSR